MTQPVTAKDFARLSESLMAEQLEQPTVQAVVDEATRFIGGCDIASVTLRRRRGRLETIAASDERATEFDQWQYELGDGPCVAAVVESDSFLAPDIGHDERWPVWGAKVAAAGIGSVLSIRLSPESTTVGALNLYATTRDAYGPDDVDHATIFATHAANALISVQMITGLRTAVHTRHRIGIAQGILVARYGLTVDQSFELLRRLSSETNTKLRDLAEIVIDAGALP